jgi:hypothetical protein
MLDVCIVERCTISKMTESQRLSGARERFMTTEWTGNPDVDLFINI